MTNADSFPRPLVGTDWLAAHLGEAGLVVMDGSWRMPGGGRARDDYGLRRIPGALFFDIDEIADRASPLPHMLPDPKSFEAAVGAMGVTEGDRIVVYDDQGVFSAARVWWTFLVMGHDNVSVLDGGLPKWRREGRPLTDESEPRTGAAYRARPRNDFVLDAAGVRSALADPGWRVADARPAGRFLGAEPEPRPRLRSGHMPGSVNIPASRLVGADGTLKPPADLARIFDEAGLGPNKRVASTCGSGVGAALICLALVHIGRAPCAVYDGSWAEWGDENADPALFPVATGA